MTLELTGERTLPGIPEENYWFRRHVAAYRFAAGRLRGRLLDVGSGEGYGTRILGRRARVLGLELDPESVTHAAGRYSTSFLQADICRLPIRERCLDGVVAIQVLEHLHCADGFMQACRDALRAGGLLVLATPNRLTFPAGENPSHVHEYTPGELGGLLRAHFDDVRLLGLRHRRLLGGLDRMLGEPVQHRLTRVGYSAHARWLRSVLRSVRAWDFRIDDHLEQALDLIAVCRRP